MQKSYPLRDLLVPASRGIAASLALFTLLNIAGSHLNTGFDANIWWIDLRFLPPFAAGVLLFTASLGLLCFAAGLGGSAVVRRGISLSIALLIAATLVNTFSFYREWINGRIHPGVPIPLSLILTVILGWIFFASLEAPNFTTRHQRFAMLVAFTASLILFPLSQMYCFGKTDYRRPADAIIVFGARTYADGTPSLALSDRTRTAVHLYEDHLAPFLIFSGGPGDGATSEPQAMRRLALSLGVPASAIILDEHGLTTEKTVSNSVAIFTRLRAKRILAVSHFYHLPRVKLAYSRVLLANHINTEVLTIPAEETRALPRMPWYLTREVAALWTYYLRPLV